MDDKSRRDALAIIGGAAVAAVVLPKVAAAEPPKQMGARRIMNIAVCVPAGNEALLNKVTTAVQQALGNNVPINPQPSNAQWDQSGGWFQDVQGGWSQSGGWVRDVNGLAGGITRLSQTQAVASPALTSVRAALLNAQLGGTSQ